MKIEEINTIAVVGAGTMGAGIAQMSAMAGYKTFIFDINTDSLEKAKVIISKNLEKGIEKRKVSEKQKEDCLDRVTLITDLEKLKADVIIEAVVEKLSVKIDLFSKLEEFNNIDTIFATNTSSIPITQIGAGLKHPERLVGMHFFNPAHIMKLVEIISGVATDIQTALTVKELAVKMGKRAVMAKDSPGFIVNRVARHFYVESLKIAEEGVADFKQIDKLVESSGFKMGPFTLMDLIGVDTNFSVTKSMFESFHYDPKFRPSRIQQQKVDAGHNGRKSGKGFYEY
ncbi:3-hydroxybutyryl-CoA dehydrogenase [Marivirga sp. S37H4]|uniref:3-hydroxybutyryl-CoA dehydrogenase n=1 Tax=Marivirga aurantiaca TaxID=2802615 RepID=A0A934X247_9BACT|nr:3-hydroxyacyl-CoA dehydrogenase NAD-binding domain-containing protein [Marivirga aurantiaca]MBK6267052.1 3-hydroxybutyryl-CoA dehydrogenase [Marivirga aurantiaca]